MGLIGLLLLAYIIYLIYNSRKELSRLFSNKSNHISKKSSPFQASDKNSDGNDILNGDAEYVDFEEIDDDNN